MHSSNTTKEYFNIGGFSAMNKKNIIAIISATTIFAIIGGVLGVIAYYKKWLG